MKNLLLTLTAAVCTITSFAQSTSGRVRYERTISLGEIKLDNVPAEVAAMMPKEHKETKVLYFTAEKSLYENAPQPAKDEAQDLQTSGNMQLRIRHDVPDEKIYTDLKNKKTVQQKPLMDRTFLVNEDVTPYKWKITGNQKKIMDRAAMEATVTTDKDTITAWFTTEIPVPAGPDDITGLPGLVLEATVNSRVVIRAVEITADETVAAKIKEPTKGKKVTAEQFAKISKEKQEEMRREFGGNGNVIIRTIQN